MTTTIRATLWGALAFVLLLPVSTFAQATTPAPATTNSTTRVNSLQDLLKWLVDRINDTLVPLVFALAFALFLFGVFRYFFSTGINAEEKRREGRTFIMWAIIALAVMICVWGIVNVIAGTVPGLKDETTPRLPTFQTGQ